MKTEMKFTPRQPPQKKTEIDVEFEDHGGAQVFRIALDKKRVYRRYQFGDKDLILLHKKLTKHIKDNKIGGKS